MGVAFIPADNEKLTRLKFLNQPLIDAAQSHAPSSIATLDQDATLSGTYKRKALYCYKKFKSYQPLNTYWAEHKVLVHSKFRDGNVPAGFEQLRVLKTALSTLPSSVKHVLLRSDSAGYQEELLDYCAEGRDPRFGTIDFAIAARVSASLKKKAMALAQIGGQFYIKSVMTATRMQPLKSGPKWALCQDLQGKVKNRPSIAMS